MNLAIQPTTSKQELTLLVKNFRQSLEDLLLRESGISPTNEILLLKSIHNHCTDLENEFSKKWEQHTIPHQLFAQCLDISNIY